MVATLTPVLVVIVIGALHYLLSLLGLFDFPYLATIFWAVSSFSFGLSLHEKSRNSNTWILKLVIAFIMFLLLSHQFGWITVPWLSNIVSGIYIYLIYIWCGWAFFRK